MTPDPVESSTNQHFYSLLIASLTGPSSFNSLCHFSFFLYLFYLPISFILLLISTYLPWLLIYHCRLRTAFCPILVPNATPPPSCTPHHVLQRISFAAPAAVNGLDLLLPLPLPPSPAPASFPVFTTHSHLTMRLHGKCTRETTFRKPVGLPPLFPSYWTRAPQEKPKS